jgi:hypothetical protein
MSWVRDKVLIISHCTVSRSLNSHRHTPRSRPVNFRFGSIVLRTFLHQMVRSGSCVRGLHRRKISEGWIEWRGEKLRKRIVSSFWKQFLSLLFFVLFCGIFLFLFDLIIVIKQSESRSTHWFSWNVSWKKENVGSNVLDNAPQGDKSQPLRFSVQLGIRFHWRPGKFFTGQLCVRVRAEADQRYKNNEPKLSFVSRKQTNWKLHSVDHLSTG